MLFIHVRIYAVGLPIVCVTENHCGISVEVFVC